MANSSTIPTKIGQLATSSPRTHESGRRRFSNFFRNFTSIPATSPTKLANSNSQSSMNQRQTSIATDSESHLEGEKTDEATVRDEGCFVDSASSVDQDVDESLEQTVQGGRCQLLDLPDELYVLTTSSLLQAVDTCSESSRSSSTSRQQLHSSSLCHLSPLIFAEYPTHPSSGRESSTRLQPLSSIRKRSSEVSSP